MPSVPPVALYALDVADYLREQGAIERMRAVVFAGSRFEQVLDPGIENKKLIEIKNKSCTYHCLRSAKPLHNESVRTFLSMSFFHSMPSDITLNHSLHTSSAFRRLSASKYDKIFSATWSSPCSESSSKFYSRFPNCAIYN